MNESTAAAERRKAAVPFDLRAAVRHADPSGLIGLAIPQEDIERVVCVARDEIGRAGDEGDEAAVI